MRLGFSDEVVHDVSTPINSQKMDELVRRIESYYQVSYRWTRTKKGYRMRPKPQFELQRRCFPQLTLTESNGKVKIRRHLGVFVIFWFSLLAMFELFLIMAWIAGGIERTDVVFWPLVVAAIGYISTKIASETDGRPILQCASDVAQNW